MLNPKLPKIETGDLIVHAKGTIYPRRYLLGIVLKTSTEMPTHKVLWFHSGRRQWCKASTLTRLEDYESR
jgi:hypothetical protein